MNTVILTALVSKSVLFGGSMMLNNNDCNERMENYYQDDANFGESQNHMNDSKYKGMMVDANNYSKMHMNNNYQNMMVDYDNNESSMHMNTNDYQDMMVDYDNNESSMHMNTDSNLKRNTHMSNGSSMHNNNGHGMRN